MSWPCILILGSELIIIDKLLNLCLRHQNHLIQIYNKQEILPIALVYYKFKSSGKSCVLSVLNAIHSAFSKYKCKPLISSMKQTVA